MVNNADWYKKISITDFLAGVGRHFRVGTMLGRTSVETRLKSESGISFTEFSYQVLQASDWLHLLQEHKCRFQVNITFLFGCSINNKSFFSRLEAVTKWETLYLVMN